MTKYREYYNRMVKENKIIFDKFTQAHFEYSTNEDKYQEKFNHEGEIVLKIVHEWEDKLCKQSEKAGFGKYSGNLAEKFQEEVRSHFPLVDHIGIIINPNIIKMASDKKIFKLKKISLT